MSTWKRTGFGPGSGRVPVHPGEILREEFMQPLGLSARALARELCVPAPVINDVARERRGISAGLALRLARYFGTSARAWTGLQSSYELDVAAAAEGAAINKTVKPRPMRRAA
jgi:antitoxin HigA-1